jgi:IMP dehydrogenase
MGDKMLSPFKLNRGMMPMSISRPEYRTVPLEKLIVNQDEVYKGGVREKLKEFERHGPEGVSPVRVTKSGGKLYLLDGHHRAAAAKLLGLKKIEAEIQKEE